MNRMKADELLHQIKQIARDEVGHRAVNTWGYVAAYDATTHSIQAILPSFRVSSPSGQTQPVQTDWIQLGTTWSGDGFGDQAAPYAAAATPQNPGAGEQVQITIVSESTGVSIATAMLYNTAFPPPGQILGRDLAAGERIIISQAGKSIGWAQSGGVGNSACITVNAGTTPVAIEGSDVTHNHSLADFTAMISTAIGTVTAAEIASSGGAAIATVLNALVTPTNTTFTDTAGDGGTTDSAVDVGKGAQDFLAPAPGGT